MHKKIRRWLITLGVVATLFIPTYIAVISYIAVNSMPEPINADEYGISIASPSGTELKIDEADLSSVKELFLKMRRDGVPCDPEVLTQGYAYRVSFSGKENADCTFVFFDDARGFMTSGDSMYKLEKRDVEAFISTKYASDMFANSSLPKLLSEGSHIILPESGEWQYIAYGKEMINADVDIRDRTVTYNHSKDIDLAFSLKPDACTIRIKLGNDVIYDGDFYSYLGKSFDETHKLEYEIEASWSSKGYRGSARYHFYADIGKPAEFSIYYGKYDQKYIEFIEVSAVNVSIPEDAALIIEPSVGTEPVFRTDGTHVRAVIPFGKDAKEGKYKIIAAYGNVTEEFEFEYVKRPDQYSNNPYPAIDDETLERYRADYLSLIKRVGNIQSNSVYMNRSFVDPEDPGSVYSGSCSLLIGFGRVRRVSGTDAEYSNDGVVYKTSGGVYALNSGKVVKTGEDGWLGKYVVVDHGLGIKTWYANLLSIDVNEGDTVKSSQALGMAGNTGYTDKNTFGFYLMVTVDGIPISPYALLEDGLPIEQNAG